MKEVLYEIASFPVPVICLLNGDAVGGGCEIATACDLRISRGERRFGFIQSTLGITPGWGGGVLLYEKVHPSFALQWIMEGAHFQADELRHQGWIHRIIAEKDWQDQEYVLQPYLSKSEEQMKTLKSQYKKNYLFCHYQHKWMMRSATAQHCGIHQNIRTLSANLCPVNNGYSA